MDQMKTSDYFYHLPPELIAQTPAEKRDHSRLLCLDRKSGAISHRQFFELPALLHRGDCLVVNNTRVIPARLIGQRDPSGGTVEVLLLRDLGGGLWETLTRPGKKTRPGQRLSFGDGLLTAQVERVVEDGKRHVRFFYDGIFAELLDRLGQMPLPPYITETLADRDRYQTVYAKESGSAAAPTAGLHFTEQLLEQIGNMGVSVVPITLHVGLGTFRPVKEENIKDHQMHTEWYHISEQSAETINRTRAAGGRIISVGTTVCRTLETVADENGKLRGATGETDIFIYPGYRFRAIDGLITNFHLPESTLIMLVSAFAGREHVLEAYREAVEARYRFFSFGDAMFIGDMTEDEAKK